MNLHLENYDKLWSPNAKMMALKRAKEALDEEIMKIYNSTVLCKCGFLMEKDEFEERKITHVNPNGFPIYWVDCPCCGKPIYR